MKDQNHIPPSPRVPGLIDFWARGIDVDVTIFDNEEILYCIEYARVQRLCELCIAAAEAKNDPESKAGFVGSFKLELLQLVTDYYSKKPYHGTRRFGFSDKDQIKPYHPNFNFVSREQDQELYANIKADENFKYEFYEQGHY